MTESLDLGYQITFTETPDWTLNNISVETLGHDLALAVAERGSSYAYELPEGYDTCQYLDVAYYNDPQPPAVVSGPAACGCIFGLLMFRWGVPLDIISSFEGRGIDVVLDESFRVAHDVCRAAHAAQTVQDNGELYGRVLTAYRSEARGVELDTEDDVDG